MPVAAYVRLSSLMPTKRFKPNLKQVALKAYSDGSGNARSLVFSGLIASPDAWDEFEDLWLRATDGAPPWHSADAMALPEPRGEFRDWGNRTKVLALRARILNDCFNEAKHLGFIHASCAVLLDDYQRAVADAPKLAAWSPYRLCATHVANIGLDALNEDAASPTGKTGFLAMYFDRGEGFLNGIKKELEARQGDKNDPVSHILLPPGASVASYKSIIGLQAADYMAWHTYRSVTRPSRFSDPIAVGISWFAARHVAQEWDYDRLIEASAEL